MGNWLRWGLFGFQTITELVTNIFPIPLITDLFWDPLDIIVSAVLTFFPR